jgi:hypothetical protein
VNDRPRRLFAFLMALSALSREHGIVIVDGDIEFRDGAQGVYKLNPNNEGPEFAWDEAKMKP